jgi:ABC-type sugar transport system ATPase subunit
LSKHEVDVLLQLVRDIKQKGVCIIFVSHRLEEVFGLCDRATVLRDGRHVITAPTSDFTPGDLVRHMVGRSVSLFPRSSAEIGEILLDVRNLTRVGAFRDVSFSVRTGEIVGLAGLVGAGRTEVARVLFGLDRADSGEVRLAGKRVSFKTPSAALGAGVAYVPEDRHLDGLVGGFTISENVTLPIVPRLFPHLFMRSGPERALAAGYAERLRIRANGMNDLIEALSGGNQQKVVIAKWLATKPRVLILDEPTRGVDIGAKVEVHRIISDLAAAGLGIILISSELPEVLAMSDRILVLHEGRGAAEIPRAEASEERVMFAATGQIAQEASSGS